MRFLLPRSECLRGKRVADVGCGHGLPGIFALSQGASFVCFQDLNRDCLEFVTMPNCVLNNVADCESPSARGTARFVYGDWRDPKLASLMLSTESASDVRYDYLFSCDTLYSIESIPALLDLISRLMAPGGCAIICAKTFYFGVGGSTAAFLDLVERHETLTARVVEKLADGSSNVREIIEVRFNSYTGTSC